ncbi:MAG: DUF423 domain-containing protein [Cyclobacteriaceae bacterium]|nr:DUF423 domain-containing protein [Cyclobacteriaceae bacterium]
MNAKQSLFAGSLLGLLGVGLGAFGAHALHDMLTASDKLHTYELAVRYQFYHAFALLLGGVIQNNFPSRWLKYSSLCFLSGVIFFCGSLYTLSFISLKGVALVTPFGGVLLMSGWILLLVGIGKGAK